MTTSPYSIDLRKKVINYLKVGGKQKVASEVFGIHTNTISRWWNRNKKEGNVEAKMRIGRAGKVKIKDLSDYLNAHPNSTTAEIGKRFGITYGGAYYWLKKLGFSYKKKSLPMWKRMKIRGQYSKS